MPRARRSSWNGRRKTRTRWPGEHPSPVLVPPARGTRPSASASDYGVRFRCGKSKAHADTARLCFPIQGVLTNRGLPILRANESLAATFPEQSPTVRALDAAVLAHRSRLVVAGHELSPATMPVELPRNGHRDTSVHAFDSPDKYQFAAHHPAFRVRSTAGNQL